MKAAATKIYLKLLKSSNEHEQILLQQPCKTISFIAFSKVLLRKIKSLWSLLPKSRSRSEGQTINAFFKCFSYGTLVLKHKIMISLISNDLYLQCSDLYVHALCFVPNYCYQCTINLNYYNLHLHSVPFQLKGWLCLLAASRDRTYILLVCHFPASFHFHLHPPIHQYTHPPIEPSSHLAFFCLFDCLYKCLDKNMPDLKHTSFMYYM